MDLVTEYQRTKGLFFGDHGTDFATGAVRMSG